MEMVVELLGRFCRQCYAVLCLGVILVFASIARFVYGDGELISDSNDPSTSGSLWGSSRAWASNSSQLQKASNWENGNSAAQGLWAMDFEFPVGMHV